MALDDLADENTSAEKASHVADLIDAKRDSPENVISDYIADFLHAARQRGLDAEHIHERAWHDFYCEVDDIVLPETADAS